MKHKCVACAYQTDDIVACGIHYETAHRNIIPPGMSGEHFAYYILTGRKHGNCAMCKKPTKWNPNTHKYQRLCSEKCSRAYGQIKGLNNPKIQQEMLANRKISGEYIWSSGMKKSYTGSYEMDLLRHLDQDKHWDPLDVLTPCPHIFTYYYDGQKRFYIPDLMIVSQDLIIEVKDGDPNNPDHNANKHPDIMRVNREKERLKRAAVKRSPYHYMVVYNKDYRALDAYLQTNKKMYLTEDANSVINKTIDTAKKLFPGFPDQVLNFIDKWREFVKEKELERYCKVSMKLNDSVYSAIKSEKFEKILLDGSDSKEFIQDLLSVNKGEIKVSVCIMDTDIDIKSEFSDPYHTYTQEYQDAKGKLLKWKKPLRFIYITSDADISFEEEMARLVHLEWEDPDN